MKKDNAKNLLKFIEASPSVFHVIKNMSDILDKNDFTRLYESNPWQLQEGKSYYTIRNDSSIIAFKIPKGGVNAFQIMASHSDSPSFKVKENPEMEVEKHYIKLNVEKYGGMLMAPWFDRPLSLAGRAMIRENGKIVTRLINVDRDLVLIPNLAIHMNRQANDGYAYNAQNDMLPLFGGISAKGTYKTIIAKAAGVAEADVLSSEIFCYNRQSGTIWGADNEFISSPKLDDLECA
ncbi:MAG: M18 family aminopeptidase, partial [Oscillospiraceae bacterium]